MGPVVAGEAMGLASAGEVMGRADKGCVPSHNRDNVPTERRICFTDPAISFE
jgi:hypothetical protein